MKVGFLGPSHSYTDEAARAVFPSAERIPLISIDAVFAAVEDGQVERGVVPIENVLQGMVTETRENLARREDKVAVVDTQLLAIDHALGALRTNAAINRVLSKDQALAQCSNYLRAKLPDADLLDTPSTTHAMQLIVEQRWDNAAAIGSATALEHYGLKVIARSIGDTADNRTLFGVIARRDKIKQG